MMTMSTRDSNLEAGAALLKEYAAAVSSGDLERWLSLWTEAGIQMAPDAPKRASRDEIRAAMDPLFDLYEHEMTVEPEDVRIAGDWGIVRGVYTHAASAKTRSERSDRSGEFLTVIEKQSDGSWKIACDCFNYNAPAE